MKCTHIDTRLFVFQAGAANAEVQKLVDLLPSCGSNGSSAAVPGGFNASALLPGKSMVALCTIRTSTSVVMGTLLDLIRSVVDASPIVGIFCISLTLPVVCLCPVP